MESTEYSNNNEVMVGAASHKCESISYYISLPLQSFLATTSVSTKLNRLFTVRVIHISSRKEGHGKHKSL